MSPEPRSQTYRPRFMFGLLTLVGVGLVLSAEARAANSDGGTRLIKPHTGTSFSIAIALNVIGRI